jgi:hypothetical protein
LVTRQDCRLPAEEASMKSSALALAAAAGLLAAVTSPGLAAARVQPAQTGTTAPVCSAGTCTGTFTTPGTGQTFVVPAGVSSMSVTLYGGAGGGNFPNLLGGDGAEVTATLAISPGATLGVDVGGAGEFGGGVGGAGGVNGGGSSAAGGGGGGATDVTLSGASLLVAGGGGGAGQGAFNQDGCFGPGGLVRSAPGGAGGNADTAGGNGQPFIDGGFSVNGGAGGGTGSAVQPGAGGTGGTFTGTDPCQYYDLDPGATGDPGSGSNGAAAVNAGAGGGGYFGGGGGGEDAFVLAAGFDLLGATGGGGGGSSYTGGAGVSGASVNDTGNPENGGGNGKAMFSYPDPLATGSPSYAVPAGQTLGVPAGNGLLSATAGASGPTGDALTASGPAGGATQAGGSVDVNPDGSFFYTPPTGYSGADSFTYQVADASGDYATGTVTVQVQPLAQAITFTSSPPDPASVGGPSYTPAATGGGSGNPVTFSVDASSTAGACSISSGVVSFGGIGTCVVDANQTGGGEYAPAPEASQAITVDQGPAFLLDGPPSAAATGQVYSYTFAASGTPAPSYALAPGAPAWVSINASTGTLTAVPPKGTTSFSYQVVAANPAGSVTAGPFTVAVKTVVPKADLSAALSCPAALAVGGSGTCTLTVTSHGPAAAAGAKAVLLLPSELSETGCTGCTRHQKAVTWKLGTVKSQATVTLTLTVHARAAGQGTVTATVDSTTTDPKPYNNLATTGVTVQG